MLDQDGSQHSGAQSVDVKLEGGNIDDWEVTEKTPVADVAQRYRGRMLTELTSKSLVVNTDL